MILVDPMLASGGSALRAIDVLKVQPSRKGILVVKKASKKRIRIQSGKGCVLRNVYPRANLK